MRFPAIAALLLALFLPLQAQSLSLNYSFLIDVATDIPAGPESLAVGTDPNDGQLGIFVGDSESSGDVLVYKFNGAAWTLDRRFTPVNGPFGLDFLPNGNLLTLGGGSQQVTEVSALDGSLIAGGINFNLGLLEVDDLEAGVFADGDLYLSGEPDFGDSLGYRRSFLGAPVNLPGLMTDTFVIGDVSGNGSTDANYGDAGASAYDPATQRIYIADDSSGGGASRIFVYDLSGNLVDALTQDFSLESAGTAAAAICAGRTRGQCDDIEGLAIATIGGQTHLLVAIEDQQLVIGFTLVPEPALAGLLLAGLGAIAIRRRS